jgi:hypothetical protein
VFSRLKSAVRSVFHNQGVLARLDGPFDHNRNRPQLAYEQASQRDAVAREVSDPASPAAVQP